MQEFDRSECPSFEIAAYIDGELDPARESDLGQHFAACAVCSAELNQQKHFLCTLSSSLMHEQEIELPRDFAKTIVANAESSVNGLRRPRERFNAVFICATLFLFGLFALGAESGGGIGRLIDIYEKLSAAAGFFAHATYSFLLGLGFVVRTLGEQTHIPVAVSLLSVMLFSIVLILVSSRWIRFRRI